MSPRRTLKACVEQTVAEKVLALGGLKIKAALGRSLELSLNFADEIPALAENLSEGLD